MTTDRELLELAAKAAKIPYMCCMVGSTGSGGVLLKGEWDGPAGWRNPLTDDGDALRLAVRLNLWEAIRLAHREVSNTVDIYAATRRAITRAAAEIARAQAEGMR